jgi:YHS domain-containing protein
MSFLPSSGAEIRKREEIRMVKDPVCGMDVDETKAAATSVYEGTTYYFCAQACKDAFEKAPAKYLEHED